MEHLIGFFGNYSSQIIYPLSFFVLFLCGLGTPLPEDFVLLTIGYFIHTGDLQIIPSLIVAYSGVLTGDSTLYFIGRTWGTSLLKVKVFNKIFPQKKIDVIKEYFESYGSITVFVARYIAGVRSVTAVTAGIVKFSYVKYITVDSIGAVIFVPLLIYLGYFFGENIDLIARKVKEFELYIGIIGILVILSLIYYSVKKNKKQ